MDAEQLSDKNSLIRSTIICIIILICFIVFFSAYSSFSSVKRTVYDSGWTVTYHNKVYHDVDLYTFRLPEKIKKNDQVVLENIIPLDIGSNQGMAFQTYFSTVTVYINRRVAYVYMNNKDRRVQMPGNGLNSVILPDNARGSECQVIIKAGDNNAFRALPIFYFVDAWNSSAMHMSMYLGTSLIGFFLTLLGVILLFLSVAMLISGRSPARVYLIGLMAFSIGVWSLSTGNVLELFSSDFTINTQIEYLCMYFTVIPFSIMVAHVRGRSSRKWKRIIMDVGLAIPTVFFVLAAILDISGMAFVSKTFNAFIVSVVLCFVLIYISTGDRGEGKSRDTKIISTGINILFAGIVADVIRYILRNRIIIESRVLYRSILPYISLAFILIMLYAYLLSLNDMYMEQSENQMLQKMAYTDVLTGLRNRAYCRQIIDQMAKKKGHNDYSILSMDVNGLKRINDSMGHAMGDQLIRDCAKILTETFEDVGEVIRMGGDEFVVIVYGSKSRHISKYISRMERLENIVSEKRKYMIRISYGIASSFEETDIEPENVYKIADARMYEMKKKMKSMPVES